MEKDAKKKMGEYNFTKHDKLGRFDFCNNITKEIFSTKTEGSLVVALNAPWGTGKTQLIKMWGNEINLESLSDEPYRAIYYSAWENDDWTDAFTPFVYNLAEDRGKMEEFASIIEIMGKTSSRKLMKLFGRAIIDILLNQVGVSDSLKKDMADLISESKESVVQEAGLDVSDEFKEYSKSKIKLKSYLEKIHDGKIVFFIDELDRCKPTFAIETLEIIKHFFDLDNFIFVLSLDLMELVKSIEAVYGKGIDPTKYLAKFIDFRIDIPKVEKKYLSKFVFSCMKIQEIETNEKELLVDALTLFFNEFDYELRDIILVINMINTFVNIYFKGITTFKTKYQSILVYVYIMLIKYKSTPDYIALISGGRIIIEDSQFSVLFNMEPEYGFKHKFPGISTGMIDLDKNIFENLNCSGFKTESNTKYVVRDVYTSLSDDPLITLISRSLDISNDTILNLDKDTMIGSIISNKLEYFNKLV